MSESVAPNEYPYLKYFQDKREGLGQEVLNVDLLTAQAGSQDVKIAQEAKKQLRIKWDLDHEKDARNAETVNIMEQLGTFTETERERMISQLVGIQLTEGCNGNCPFCLFGKKKGVEAKYSFDSVTTFLRKYGYTILKEPSLYWDSDPFDYRDGEHNFTDIYRTWREIRPAEFQFVSTTIPRGSEDDFVDFMRNAAREQKGRKHGNPDISLRVRVSLAKHNTQRVEATFGKLTETLLEDGYTQQEINDFYYACLEVGERFENVHQIGPLISGHDDIRDVYTPACRDGVLITPKSIKAIMMTVPIVYEPSGEKDIPISPGQTETQTPLLRRILDYAGFDADDSLVARTYYRQTMMDIVRTSDRAEYQLPDKTEDVILKLGRETASLGRLIIDLAELPSAPKAISKPLSDRQKYLKVATQVFRDRQTRTQEQIARAREYSDGDVLPAIESEKIQFYILLTETYLAEMDFLADQVEEGQSIETVAAMATTFRQIGREKVSELPKIIEGLAEIGREIKIEPGSETDITMVESRLLRTIGQPFGFDSLKQDNLPDWFRKLVDAYTGKKGSAT